MTKKEIDPELTELLGSDRVWADVPMKDQIAFRVGGAADFLVMPETCEQLMKVLSFCREVNLPHYLMGNGSNLLVKDGGYRGAIIKTRAMDSVTVTGNTLVAEAGAMMRKVADCALQHGLKGLAFASGIPGTIGGGVMMNAGAYGGEMKNIVKAVEVLTMGGEIKTCDNKDCDFGYRHSAFQLSGEVILRVHLALQPGDPQAIATEMKELNARRREKQPLEYPSAGSTFKRPEGHFAGKLIEDSGMKGYRVGGAMVSEKHAGFVINVDHASAAHVLQVIEDVQKNVMDCFGVALQPEVIMIGED